MTPFVEYFKSFGEISNPAHYRESLEKLPDDPRDICKVVQSLIIHPLWLSNYGVTADEGRLYGEQQARSVVDIITNIEKLDPAPINKPRKPAARTIGTCRNYSLLFCSVLRSKSVPARLRCGFATYFDTGRYIDHWICEYWSDSEKYWVRVDPQLDELQVRELGINFDPCDVPIDAYLYAGEAWTMCRRERADAADFGIADLNGMGFIKGNIVRDILALNKIETLPWDHGWGMLDEAYLRDVDRNQLGYIDRLARCSANSLVHLAHSFFKDDDQIRFPEGWDLSLAPTLGQLMASAGRL